MSTVLDHPEALLGLGLGALTGALAAWLYFQVWRSRYLRKIRQDTVRQSQAVISGKVHEQLLPYFPGFPFNPKDVRFLGSPVDLVVFDGLSAGNVERVVLIEVKTGGAVLTARERQVRDAVKGGRVDWLELKRDG
jgi:predicted Holliday junction resolvase-like endonuclease